MIGETSFTSGPATLHEKAIYLVEGVLYQVEKLDFEGRKAYVGRSTATTTPTRSPTPRSTVLETFEPRTRARPHGEVHVVVARRRLQEDQVLHERERRLGELDLPEQQMHTTAYWLTIPRRSWRAAVRRRRSPRRRGGAVVRDAPGGAAAADVRSPGHRRVDRQRRPGRRRGSRTGARHPARRAAIFIYDNYPGGIGFSQPLFAMHAELLRRTREVIAGCECEHGCPTCVGPVGNTGPLAKLVALRILDRLARCRWRRRRSRHRPRGLARSRRSRSAASSIAGRAPPF